MSSPSQAQSLEWLSGRPSVVREWNSGVPAAALCDLAAFDLDGVLVDSEDIKKRSWADASNRS